MRPAMRLELARPALRLGLLHLNVVISEHGVNGHVLPGHEINHIKEMLLGQRGEVEIVT